VSEANLIGDVKTMEYYTLLNTLETLKDRYDISYLLNYDRLSKELTKLFPEESEVLTIIKYIFNESIHTSIYTLRDKPQNEKSSGMDMFYNALNKSSAKPGLVYDTLWAYSEAVGLVNRESRSVINNRLRFLYDEVGRQPVDKILETLEKLAWEVKVRDLMIFSDALRACFNTVKRLNEKDARTPVRRGQIFRIRDYTIRLDTYYYRFFYIADQIIPVTNDDYKHNNCKLTYRENTDSSIDNLYKIIYSTESDSEKREVNKEIRAYFNTLLNRYKSDYDTLDVELSRFKRLFHTLTDKRALLHTLQLQWEIQDKDIIELLKVYFDFYSYYETIDEPTIQKEMDYVNCSLFAAFSHLGIDEIHPYASYLFNPKFHIHNDPAKMDRYWYKRKVEKTFSPGYKRNGRALLSAWVALKD
jgi:molecular chaperone GrpE (heat shock protein)